MKIHNSEQFSFYKAVITLLCLVTAFATNAIAQEQNDTEYDDLFSDMDQSSDSIIESDIMTFSAMHCYTMPVLTGKNEYGYQPLHISPVTHKLQLKIDDKNITALTGVQIHNPADSDALTDAELAYDQMYIRYRMSGLNITAGNIIYSWGSADSLNPTDRLNPRDERNPYDMKKVPLTSLMVSLFTSDSFSLDFILIPGKPDNLRGGSSESSSFTEESTPSEPISGTEFSIDKGGHHLEDTRFAVRSRSQLSFGDITFSYILDTDSCYTADTQLDQFSTIAQTETDPQAAEIRYMGISGIKLSRPTVHRAGFDLRLPAGGFMVWSESCLSIPHKPDEENYSKRKSEFETTIGLDKTYGRENRGYFNIQYNLRYIPNHDYRYYDDYKNGMPDYSRVNDKDYMNKYYSRTVYREISGQYSVQRHTVMFYNRWELLLNRIKIKTGVGYQFSHGLAKESGMGIGAAIGELKTLFTLQDALLLEGGIHQCLPLEYSRDSGNFHKDRESELYPLYEANYIYFMLSWKWSR
ncbi:MAG: hypothetical protein JXK07_04255 [Spirochaetes bacterium]|nr:hypothetical protein [Spirochaetota bacterium]MBN2770929.1 hypothetical protein [Spirochaetota bacterium]